MSARTTSHEEAPSSKDFGNFNKALDQSLVDLNAPEKDYYISPPQPKIGSTKSLAGAMSPLTLVSAPEILQKGFQLESRKYTKCKSAIPITLKEKEDVPTENLLAAQSEGFSIRKHIRAATYSLWNRKNN